MQARNYLPHGLYYSLSSSGHRYGIPVQNWQVYGSGSFYASLLH